MRRTNMKHIRLLFFNHFLKRGVWLCMKSFSIILSFLKMNICHTDKLCIFLSSQYGSMDCGDIAAANNHCTFHRSTSYLFLSLASVTSCCIKSNILYIFLFLGICTMLIQFFKEEILVNRQTNWFFKP